MIERAYIRLQYTPQAVRLVWDAAPRWTVVWLAFLVLQGLLPAAMVYLTRLVVDDLVGAVDGGLSAATLQPFIISAGLMVVTLVLMEALSSAGSWVQTAQAESVQDHVREIIHEKAITVDLGFYESPRYFDQLYRAQQEASSRPLSLVKNLGALLQHGITVTAILALLFPYGPWVPLVLLVGTLPAFFIVLHFNRRYHDWWETSTERRRWTGYYEMLLTNSVAAGEMRLFGIGPHLKTAHAALRRVLRGEKIALTRDQMLARLVGGLLTLATTGGVMAWMVWRVLQGAATLGDLALFYQAFSRGQGLARTLLHNVEQLYSDSLFLGNLFDFLALEPQVVGPPDPLPPPVPLRDGVHVENVTFCYPGSEQAALRDFSLFIPAGKVVAIVGANGAGKTTLLKLLCRFYDPQQGRITLDGVDLRQLATEDLRRLLTVLFQFPVPYYATVAENIAFSDLQAAPNAQTIEAAAHGAGAHEFISRLPRGYDTLLGRWFADGVELSGGEWQRLALARAFLKRAQIIILDEPTSHMDSWAEADWLDRFRLLAQGKTGIVITHRFTLAMRADVIHVMERGKIVESGSHEELLALGGRYAVSWRTQVEGGVGHEVGSLNGIRDPFGDGRVNHLKQADRTHDEY
jgi:ATP-binding cassette, subfamily B, bacterial